MWSRAGDCAYVGQFFYNVIPHFNSKTEKRQYHVFSDIAFLNYL
jgi:hypothetical protein